MAKLENDTENLSREYPDISTYEIFDEVFFK